MKNPFAADPFVFRCPKILLKLNYQKNTKQIDLNNKHRTGYLLLVSLITAVRLVACCSGQVLGDI